jgi:DNA helicase-2/ATP-dependent DNA helicase PcrA
VALNASQREAVEHKDGPLLVLAGAGSGKTGVVTHRIAALLASGVLARSIMAVTFTNKAAAEMKERVERLVDASQCDGLWVSTFHRFGLEVLSREAAALGLRGGRFAIYDRGDCMGLVRDAMRAIRAGKNFDLGAVLGRISLAKNAFIDPDAYARLAERNDDEYDEITALVYPRYAAALRSLQAFDFDDLVCQPVLLWRRRAEVLERWRRRFRYLIVDEYQDTNLAQLEMLRLLGSDHRNVCVVGDDDQAIYAWRGADVRNILDFGDHFPGAKVVRLEHNYRSTEAVLHVANRVLEARGGQRHDKRLVPTQGVGDKVKKIVCADGAVEARFVAEEIGRLCDAGTARPRDIAVLYRSNLQAGEIESELRTRGMPYRLFGGVQAFERKEVKDVLAYLQVVADPGTELAARRSLTYPPRGVGDVALDRLGAFATAHDVTLFEAAARAAGIAGLAPAAVEGCTAYARLVGELSAAVDAGTPTAEVVKRLVEALDLRRLLFAEGGASSKQAAWRWSNVELLVRAFERRDAREPSSRAALQQFLRLLLLRQEGDDDEPGDSVTLTTMHGAKGLEFRVVFLVGLEEGFLPHARTLDERVTDVPSFDGRPSDDLEQERRLFYVAITRARERLYLCRARVRLTRGKPHKRAPSRFLADVPDDLLELSEIDETPVDLGAVQRGAADVLAALLGNG